MSYLKHFKYDMLSLVKYIIISIGVTLSAVLIFLNPFYNKNTHHYYSEVFQLN